MRPGLFAPGKVLEGYTSPGVCSDILEKTRSPFLCRESTPHSPNLHTATQSLSRLIYPGICRYYRIHSYFHQYKFLCVAGHAARIIRVTAAFWFDNLSDKSVMRVSGGDVFRSILLNKTVLSGHVARHTVERSDSLRRQGLRTGVKKLYKVHFNVCLTINTRTRSTCSSSPFQPLRPLLETLEREATKNACVQWTEAICSIT